MKVICFNCRMQADITQCGIDLAGAISNEIEREPEEVLALWIAPNGPVAGFISIPACEFDRRIEAVYLAAKRDQVPIDGSELGD